LEKRDQVAAEAVVVEGVEVLTQVERTQVMRVTQAMPVTMPMM
jgi:hypothetical protein